MLSPPTGSMGPQASMAQGQGYGTDHPSMGLATYSNGQVDMAAYANGYGTAYGTSSPSMGYGSIMGGGEQPQTQFASGMPPGYASMGMAAQTQGYASMAPQVQYPSMAPQSQGFPSMAPQTQGFPSMAP